MQVDLGIVEQPVLRELLLTRSSTMARLLYQYVCGNVPDGRHRFVTLM